MHPRKLLYLSLVNALMDVVAITVSFIFTYFVRFYTNFVPVRHIPGLLVYSQALAVIIPVYLWSFRAYGLYQPSRQIRRIEEIFLMIKAVTLAIVVLMAVTFFYRDLTYSRVFLVILWGVSVFFIGISRYFVIQWEYGRKRNKRILTNVLIIGANRNTRNILRWARTNPHYGTHVLGVLARDPGLVGKHMEQATILGVTDECENFIERLHPDQVILVESSFSRERVTDLVLTCEDKMIDFKLGADFYGLLTQNVDVEYLSTVPLLGFRTLPLDDLWNRFLKRAFDLVVSSAILLAGSPFWFLIYVMIKTDDGGPILYKQERIGRDLRHFKLLKFRTMRVDAEKDTGPVWAKPNDQRRTRFGQFLRRWNLDELPQLVNVLRGEMSLVGPRPERPHFVERFRENIPRYIARHKIKSGLTGWAQVNGYRGNTSIYERTKYDLYYMEHWSLLFDIEIILMTIFSPKAFRNAY